MNAYPGVEVRRLQQIIDVGFARIDRAVDRIIEDYEQGLLASIAVGGFCDVIGYALGYIDDERRSRLKGRMCLYEDQEHVNKLAASLRINSYLTRGPTQHNSNIFLYDKELVRGFCLPARQPTGPAQEGLFSWPDILRLGSVMRLLDKF